jgi:predicted GH43/DUF377 family glycosyl hydrolase
MPNVRHSLPDCCRLLPSEWREAAEGGPAWCFNPSVLASGEGYLMAYRVVLADGRRRIAACRLGPDLQPVEGSQAPLSDLLHFRDDCGLPERARGWFADPRLFSLQGRTFLYWNSGWHEPANHQFVAELTPRSLLPAGPARVLLLDGPRREVEKNWMFPEGLDGLCVYSTQPHRLLRFDPAAPGDWMFSGGPGEDWDAGPLAQSHGGLRGGAAPVRLGDGRMLSLCHAVEDSPCGYRYRPVAYTFSMEPPYRPLTRPARPLPLPNPAGPRNLLPRLNPAVGEVVYPSGLARHPKGWLVSYGINDEACALAVLSEEEILATQMAV